MPSQRAFSPLVIDRPDGLWFMPPARYSWVGPYSFRHDPDDKGWQELLTSTASEYLFYPVAARCTVLRGISCSGYTPDARPPAHRHLAQTKDREPNPYGNQRRSIP